MLAPIGRRIYRRGCALNAANRSLFFVFNRISALFSIGVCVSVGGVY